jgi:hypothetical protein
MLIFLSSSFYPPIHPAILALTSLQKGKNELEEKKSTLQEASHTKKEIIGGKSKFAHIAGNINLFTLFFYPNEMTNNVNPYN